MTWDLRQAEIVDRIQRAKGADSIERPIPEVDTGGREAPDSDSGASVGLKRQDHSTGKRTGERRYQNLFRCGRLPVCSESVRV